MITFLEFRGLSPDEKNSEILKCLSLLVPLGEDFSGLKNSINSAVDKVSKLEYDYGIFCQKTRSVDDILESSHNSITPNQFNSVDNIYKTSSISSRLRSRAELHLSGVSSFTQPLPDISGVSSWTNPLPDIALHTLDNGQGPSCQPLAWKHSESPEGIPSKAVILKSRRCHKRVGLNVGGVRHEVMWCMLEQYPGSKLGQLAIVETHEEIMELVTDYSLVDNEYFFDRHPRSFNSILNFYRTGKLHVNEEMCVLSFQDDLDFWGLDDALLESCCRFKYETELMCVLADMESECMDMQEDAPEIFRDNCIGRYQKCLWDLIEKPESSQAANIVSVISMMFVLVSTVGMSLNTLHGLKVLDDAGEPRDNPLLELIEAICIVWFTLEFFIRLTGSPDKCSFLKNGMNIIDVLAILPYYVELAMAQRATKQKQEMLVEPAFMSQNTTVLDNEAFEEEEDDSLQGLLQVFRVFKLARILKLARHSRGLQSIIFTLTESVPELGLLIMILIISGLIFASLTYYIEMDNDSGFTDIPTSFYWVIITMTTVGYGDIFPISGLGKLVGSMTAVSGALTMSLPLPIIVSNFEKYYAKQNLDDQLKNRRVRVAELKKEEEKIRMRELGYSTGDSSIAELMKKERGVMLFKSPSSLLKIPIGQSPSPSLTIV